MTYRVELQGPAVRALSRQLPERVAAACLELIAGPLAADPRRLGKPLRAPREGQWSARRGDYRVVYSIDDAAEVVRVLAVAHRRDAYR